MNTLPPELINMIVDAAADSSADSSKDSSKEKARRRKRELLTNMSLVHKRMLPQVQVHLFKKITFYGNSGRRGLNGWCDYRRNGNQELQVPATNVKEIKYIGLVNDVIPGGNANKCLEKLTKVVKLTVERYPEKGEDIQLETVVGMALGHQVRFLKLVWYKLDVNDFISYLRLFPKLEYLEMDGIVIEPGTLRGHPSLPKFEGVLRLDSFWYDPLTPPHEIINMLTSIPTEMKYSHIILGSRVVKEGGAENCLKPFLSKSKDTLKCLHISGESILTHDRLGVDHNFILYQEIGVVLIYLAWISFRK